MNKWYSEAHKNAWYILRRLVEKGIHYPTKKEVWRILGPSFALEQRQEATDILYNNKYLVPYHGGFYEITNEKALSEIYYELFSGRKVI